MDNTSFLQRDRSSIWHPYSQHGLHPFTLPVKSARGAYLHLEDGTQVLDGISSWWVNLHGHAHPEIAEAIHRQAKKLEHVIFSGFTHEPAINLAEILLDATKRRGALYSKVFYSDNGSTAVEAALKMAYQYHQNRGERSRQKFIALRHSYHGDTLGAMAVSEPEGFHQVFRKLLPRVEFVDADDLDQLERLISAEPDGYAAFIFEPMVQGAGGMKMYAADYLKDAISLCQRFGVLTIGDEVFTGFYRTGKCFAFEHAGVAPDLLCLSKGITGGFLPLAVTLATEGGFSAFVSDEVSRAFLHGHSYTANPIACAAAIESWRLLQEPDCLARVEMISRMTQKHVQRLGKARGVKASRSLGTIGAIELESHQNYMSGTSLTWMQRAVKRGVLLRPLGNVLYAVPPYCLDETEVNNIYETMEELIHEWV
jgi:adenosylmethionine-8-amino-7-oxononanoate aminotransferase